MSEHGKSPAGPRFKPFWAPVLALSVAGCAAASVRPWPEADRLFRRDALWCGGDGAYSVDLGKERVLWLFGDSFIASAPDIGRTKSMMIHNSIGIQTGLDPSRASMDFHWTRGGERPAAFFRPKDKEEWLWPVDGMRLDDTLLLFFMRVRKDGGDALGFALTGWLAMRVDNPDDPPADWRVLPAQTGETESDLLAGSSLLMHSGHLYAYSPREPKHEVYLQRWKIGDAARGDLSRPQWWCGVKRGWSPDRKERKPVFANGQTEFSVHRDPVTREYLAVQTIGFGATHVGLRRAPRPEGPWTAAAPIFRPPDSDRKGAFVYAAKAHPHLTAAGEGFPATYVANRFDFWELVKDASVYYPRFIRIAPARPTSSPSKASE